MNAETMSFVQVATVGDVAEDDVKKVKVGALTLALFNLGGEYFALHHLCTHEDVSLTEGFVDGGQVECPKHSGRFDIRTGRAMAAPCTTDAKTYPVRVQGDAILVGVPDVD